MWLNSDVGQYKRSSYGGGGDIGWGNRIYPPLVLMGSIRLLVQAVHNITAFNLETCWEMRGIAKKQDKSQMDPFPFLLLCLMRSISNTLDLYCYIGVLLMQYRQQRYIPSRLTGQTESEAQRPYRRGENVILFVVFDSLVLPCIVHCPHYCLATMRNVLMLPTSSSFLLSSIPLTKRSAHVVQTSQHKQT